MDNSQREMTLTEWCARLPEFHLVNRQLAALEKRIAELERRNRVLDTQVVIFEHGYKRSMIQLQVIEDRADRAEETARVLASELEAMRKEAP